MSNNGTVYKSSDISNEMVQQLLNATSNAGFSWFARALGLDRLPHMSDAQKQALTTIFPSVIWGDSPKKHYFEIHLQNVSSTCKDRFYRVFESVDILMKGFPDLSGACAIINSHTDVEFLRVISKKPWLKFFKVHDDAKVDILNEMPSSIPVFVQHGFYGNIKPSFAKILPTQLAIYTDPNSPMALAENLRDNARIWLDNATESFVESIPKNISINLILGRQGKHLIGSLKCGINTLRMMPNIDVETLLAIKDSDCKSTVILDARSKPDVISKLPTRFTMAMIRGNVGEDLLSSLPKHTDTLSPYPNDYLRNPLIIKSLKNSYFFKIRLGSNFDSSLEFLPENFTIAVITSGFCIDTLNSLPPSVEKYELECDIEELDEDQIEALNTRFSKPRHHSNRMVY